jgi:hypothetical protein
LTAIQYRTLANRWHDLESQVATVWAAGGDWQAVKQHAETARSAFFAYERKCKAQPWLWARLTGFCLMTTACPGKPVPARYEGLSRDGERVRIRRWVPTSQRWSKPRLVKPGELFVDTRWANSC